MGDDLLLMIKGNQEGGIVHALQLEIVLEIIAPSASAGGTLGASKWQEAY